MTIKRRVLVATTTAACLLRWGTARAAHSPEDARQLVLRACAYYDEHGRVAALAAFNDQHGAFRDGELYVYVLDANDPELTAVAHGANPALIGVPQRDILDADGYDFHSVIYRLVKADGDGWVTYKWPNPMTHKIQAKRSYARLDNGLIIVAGAYQ